MRMMTEPENKQGDITGTGLGGLGRMTDRPTKHYGGGASVSVGECGAGLRVKGRITRGIRCAEVGAQLGFHVQWVEARDCGFWRWGRKAPQLGRGIVEPESVGPKARCDYRLFRDLKRHTVPYREPEKGAEQHHNNQLKET